MRAVLGMFALFSGAALVIHIISGFSLRLALFSSAGVVALAIASLWRRVDATRRGRFVRLLWVGASSGILATLAYDASRYVLSLWDTSPYSPFEAIRMFGILLAGKGAAPASVYTTGSVFHLFNGMSFGVGYAFLLGQKGILAGILWGLFLEIFQITLYPGWLDIRAYREFVQISAFGHVVYGSVLGLICQHRLAGGGSLEPANFSRLSRGGSPDE
jgi:hypothetical protein